MTLAELTKKLKEPTTGLRDPEAVFSIGPDGERTEWGRLYYDTDRRALRPIVLTGPAKFTPKPSDTREALWSLFAADKITGVDYAERLSAVLDRDGVPGLLAELELPAERRWWPLRPSFEWRAVFKIGHRVRVAALAVCGLLMIAQEVFFNNAERPVILILGAALLGMPAVLHTGRKVKHGDYRLEFNEPGYSKHTIGYGALDIDPVIHMGGMPPPMTPGIGTVGRRPGDIEHK